MKFEAIFWIAIFYIADFVMARLAIAFLSGLVISFKNIDLLEMTKKTIQFAEVHTVFGQVKSLFTLNLYVRAIYIALSYIFVRLVQDYDSTLDINKGVFSINTSAMLIVIFVTVMVVLLCFNIFCLIHTDIKSLILKVIGTLGLCMWIGGLYLLKTRLSYDNLLIYKIILVYLAIIWFIGIINGSVVLLINIKNIYYGVFFILAFYLTNLLTLCLLLYDSMIFKKFIIIFIFMLFMVIWSLTLSYVYYKASKEIDD